MHFQRRGGRKRPLTAARSRRSRTRSPTARWSRRWREPTAGAGCWRRAGSARWPIWQTRNGSAAPTSAASCVSRSSRRTSPSGSSTAGRRQACRSSSSRFPSSGRDSGSGAFEEAHDDPRRGYDGMRAASRPPEHALIRAVDLPGQAKLGRSIHWCGRSPKTHELPLVRRRPTRCPRLDVLDVWQPAATADPFDPDPHTRLQDSSCP